MTPITRVKLALTLTAVIFFAIGMRTGEPWQRWVGIALLAVAVALRFVGRGTTADRSRD